MELWVREKGKNIFMAGKDAYLLAEQCAGNCSEFAADYEEEWMSDNEISCYNCKLRRWNAESFECLKEEVDE